MDFLDNAFGVGCQQRMTRVKDNAFHVAFHQRMTVVKDKGSCPVTFQKA